MTSDDELDMSENESARLHEQWKKCSVSAVYFVENYVQIESPETGGWLPFHLWPDQVEALEAMCASQQLVVLKARQLGLTWLALSYALWLMLFRAPAVILLFSLREKEAQELLRRLQGMHAHLPTKLQLPPASAHTVSRWALEGGSRALAFSTRGGRSYTATLALVDEADFVPHLADFLNSVKPTIDGGGQLLLISTADKAQPLSTFKRLYRAGLEGAGGYRSIFLSWQSHPARSKGWRRRVRTEMFAQRGSDDDLLQEYPESAEEALRMRSLAARIAAHEIAAVSDLRAPLDAAELPADLPEHEYVRVFTLPQPQRAYVAGADPAEGNPRSDESVLIILDALTGEQVALLAGKLPPDLFAAHASRLCVHFNHAPLLVERNNHGHSVLAWLRASEIHLLRGMDGKPGWLTTAISKARLFDTLARACREGALLLHDAETAAQLALVDAISLRAPDGMHDDRAMALALAYSAIDQSAATALEPITPDDPLRAYDRARF